MATQVSLNGLGPVNVHLIHGTAAKLHRQIFHGPNPMELPLEESGRRVGKENAGSEGVWRCLRNQEPSTASTALRAVPKATAFESGPSGPSLRKERRRVEGPRA